MNNSAEKIILDFANTHTVDNWEAIDDRIMGGCSQSRAEFVDGTGMRFSGTVSLENNGGFASIRSRPTDCNLGEYSGLKLRLRGDGKSYKLSLRTDLFFDGISYQVDIITQQRIWQEIILQFKDFTATHHGVKLSTVAPLETTKIKSFGLFIADRQEGLFKLDISWLKGVN